MDHEALPQSSLDLGWRILRALDSMKLRPEGAFWLFDSDVNDWKFYIVSSLVDVAGPRWMFLRFNQLLPEIVAELPGTFELYLVSPNEVLAEEVRALVDGCVDEDEAITLDFGQDHRNLVVYRIKPTMSPRDLHHARVEFRKKLREVMDARVA